MTAMQGSLQARDITRTSRHCLEIMRGANVTTPVPDKEDPTKRNTKGGLGNRATGRVAKLRHLAANQQTRLLRKAELETREAEKTLGLGGMKGKVEEPEEETPLADGVTGGTLRKGESRATGTEKTGELTIGHQTETITSN